MLLAVFPVLFASWLHARPRAAPFVLQPSLREARAPYGPSRASLSVVGALAPYSCTHQPALEAGASSLHLPLGMCVDSCTPVSHLVALHSPPAGLASLSIRRACRLLMV